MIVDLRDWEWRPCWLSSPSLISSMGWFASDIRKSTMPRLVLCSTSTTNPKQSNIIQNNPKQTVKKKKIEITRHSIKQWRRMNLPAGCLPGAVPDIEKSRRWWRKPAMKSKRIRIASTRIHHKNNKFPYVYEDQKEISSKDGSCHEIEKILAGEERRNQ